MTKSAAVAILDMHKLVDAKNAFLEAMPASERGWYPDRIEAVYRACLSAQVREFGELFNPQSPCNIDPPTRARLYNNCLSILGKLRLNPPLTQPASMHIYALNDIVAWFQQNRKGDHTIQNVLHVVVPLIEYQTLADCLEALEGRRSPTDAGGTAIMVSKLRDSLDRGML